MVSPLLAGPTAVSLDTFRADPHGARFVATVESEPDAFARLFVILNAPETDARLVERAAREPALAAVVGRVEADPIIRSILEDPDRANRFKQTVGVAVKLKMERLGWTTTGRKGSMTRYATYFGQAERYARPGTDAEAYRRRALAGLDAIAQMGTEEERLATGTEIMESLRAERERIGRPF